MRTAGRRGRPTGSDPVDCLACPYSLIATRAIGTLVVWDLINAPVLPLLLRAAIQHGAEVHPRETEYAILG
jgi:hypothetical protein